jgi:cytochrome c oxidase subunit 3
VSQPEPHFHSIEQQASAARLGMLVFLASEVLLFAGLFTLWASYRATYTPEFHVAARETDAVLGLIDTVLLLCASLAAALSVHAFRDGARRTCVAWLGTAAGLATLFLLLKVGEWRQHVVHGYVPGAHLERGVQIFWTLYFATTGLHALHATAGVGVLLALAYAVGSGRLPDDRGYVVDNGVSYWHLVDAIWLLVWPMFYLMRGGG